MLGWLQRKFLSAGNSAFRREIDDLSTRLLNLERSQVAIVLVAVARVRRGLRDRFGIDFLEPRLVWASQPQVAAYLQKVIRELRSQEGMFWDAIACEIWLHTLRGLSPLSDAQTQAATKKIWLALAPAVEPVRAIRELDISKAGFSDIPEDFDILPEGIA